MDDQKNQQVLLVFYLYKIQYREQHAPPPSKKRYKEAHRNHPLPAFWQYLFGLSFSLTLKQSGTEPKAQKAAVQYEHNDIDEHEFWYCMVVMTAKQ